MSSRAESEEGMERIVMEGTPLTLEERLERQANEIRAKEQQIEALREKTEREKGCDGCQPSCHNCKHDVYDDFCQYYGKQGCGNLLHEPKHKYCPMCGKRLGVEP